MKKSFLINQVSISINFILVHLQLRKSSHHSIHIFIISNLLYIYELPYKDLLCSMNFNKYGRYSSVN